IELPPSVRMSSYSWKEGMISWRESLESGGERGEARQSFGGRGGSGRWSCDDESGVGEGRGAGRDRGRGASLPVAGLENGGPDPGRERGTAAPVGARGGCGGLLFRVLEGLLRAGR